MVRGARARMRRLTLRMAARQMRSQEYSLTPYFDAGSPGSKYTKSGNCGPTHMVDLAWLECRTRGLKIGPEITANH